MRADYWTDQGNWTASNRSEPAIGPKAGSPGCQPSSHPDPWSQRRRLARDLRVGRSDARSERPPLLVVRRALHQPGARRRSAATASRRPPGRLLRDLAHSASTPHCTWPPTPAAKRRRPARRVPGQDPDQSALHRPGPGNGPGIRSVASATAARWTPPPAPAATPSGSPPSSTPTGPWVILRSATWAANSRPTRLHRRHAPPRRAWPLQRRRRRAGRGPTFRSSGR